MNLFSYIKAQIPIQQVIGEYVTLKPAGTYLKGKCPFHNERTGSFTVSPHKEIFYCFGCHISGDVIGFVAKLENCTQFEAAKLLVERNSLKIPEQLETEFKQISKETLNEKKRYFLLCNLVATWCHTMLQKSPSAREYLKQRGISEETIHTFSIGYFPSDPKAVKDLVSSIQKEGFLTENLLNVGILMEGNHTYYSPFEERILFPIKDHFGQYCGFGGRIYRPGDDRVKYYNSKENPYFAKGSLLYGLDIAKKDIQAKESAILVEGYTDCIMLYQHGFKNAVASLGTACTSDHLNTISRYADILYILYDGDQAGQNAMSRLTELCWNVNLELKVVKLPEADDPASFLGRGECLQPLLGQACSIVTFFIERSGKAFASKSLKQKLESASDIVQLIGNIPDPLKRSFVIQEAAMQLNIPIQTLEGHALRNRRHAPKIQQQPQQQATSPHTMMEEKFFASLLIHAETVDIKKYEYAIYLIGAPLREILQQLIDAQQKQPFSFQKFWSTLEISNQELVTKYLVMFDQQELQAGFEYNINEFNKKHWKNIVEAIKEQIAQAQQSNDQNEISRLLVQLQEMKKNLMAKMNQKGAPIA